MKSQEPNNVKYFEKLKVATKACRDEAVLKKLNLFLQAARTENIRQACAEQGKVTSYYYYWWNRYRDSGFKLEALAEKSRRPQTSPRRLDSKIVQWIVEYRGTHYSPEKIRHYLEREKNVRVSKATIYRVIRREKLPLRKFTARSRNQDRESPAFPVMDTHGLSQKLAEKILSFLNQSKKTPQKNEIQAFIKSALRFQQSSTPVPLEQNLIGNRYRLERELGRGGAGIVFLAQDLRSRGKRVALKLLSLGDQSDDVLIVSLKNEFATLAALQHRNLARVIDFDKTERELYFTSEWIDGQDIVQAAKKVDLNTLFRLIVEILGALNFLHGRGVLHLDLKPSNLLVTDPNRTGDLTVKLIDFGSAEWRKRGQYVHGEFAGTPPYAAPEIIQEQSPTPASDIYSLGMILHQLFSGQFPFASQDPFEMMKEQVYAEPRLLRELHPALPDDFANLLHKMVAKNPDDRFQSSQEVLQAMNACLGENFSLRVSSAPTHVLEESEYFFRSALLNPWVQTFLEGEPQVVVLSGPEGIGKSRFVRQLKWALQLNGAHPWLIENSKVLSDLIAGELISFQSPLLIDIQNEEDLVMNTLLDSLENLKIPVLLTTRLEQSLELNPSHWVRLQALNSEQVLGFFREEVAQFPVVDLGSEVIALSEGMPVQLEFVLQAMKEEGMIQWTDHGWHWVAGIEAKLSALLHHHETRWDNRLRRVQELLTRFQREMNRETLEGILGLEAGVLEEKLAVWVELGKLRCKTLKKIPYYFVEQAISVSELSVKFQNWTWVESELSMLYQKGEYGTGVRWADLLLSEASTQGEMPITVMLSCARHFAAGGKAKRALQILPQSPPEVGEISGLYYEIKARAELILGNLPECRELLQMAETSYRWVRADLGLSRVYNLWGPLEKIQGNNTAAEARFLESIERAKKIGDDYHQGFAQMNLANLYYELGRYPRAREVYESAFGLESSAKQPIFSCTLRHNWVNLLYHTGHAIEAENSCYEWLRLSIQHGYFHQQAAALNYLGLLVGQKNQRERQMEYYNQALGLLTPHSYPQLYFQTQLNRGHLQWALRKFTAAQLDGEMALSLAERYLGPSFACLALILLGKVLRDRPKPDLAAASHHLNTAHELVWKHQLKHTQWEVELERGLLAKRKNETDRARNYFLSARQQLESLLQELPESTRQGYLRDRKMDRITQELEALRQN